MTTISIPTLLVPAFAGAGPATNFVPAMDQVNAATKTQLVIILFDFPYVSLVVLLTPVVIATREICALIINKPFNLPA